MRSPRPAHGRPIEKTLVGAASSVQGTSSFNSPFRYGPILLPNRVAARQVIISVKVRTEKPPECGRLHPTHRSQSPRPHPSSMTPSAPRSTHVVHGTPGVSPASDSYPKPILCALSATKFWTNAPSSLSHTRYYAREIETAGGRHLQLGGHPDDGGGSSGHRMARLFAGGARFEISPP